MDIRIFQIVWDTQNPNNILRLKSKLSNKIKKYFVFNKITVDLFNSKYDFLKIHFNLI